MDIEKLVVLKSNYKNSAAIRRKLLEKYGHACAVCGIKNDAIPLQIAHLVSIFNEDESSEDNLTILCPNCHRTFDRQPREYEFVNFLSELLKNHPKFSAMQKEIRLGREIRFEIDLIVDREEKDKNETLLIECKTYPSLPPDRIQNIINQLNNCKSIYGDCRMVLAIPATLREADLSALCKANIEVWDLQYIAENFAKQIKAAEPSYYKVFFVREFPGKYRKSHGNKS